MSRTSDRTYLKNRARLKRQGEPCWICGLPIDLAIKWPDPQCFTADHVIPVGKGGHNRGEVRPAHRVCNQSRGRNRKCGKTIQVSHAREW